MTDKLANILTVALAFAAIISPSITAIINNRYHLKLRKLEIEADNKKSNNQAKKDIYMGFLQYAGKYLYFDHPEYMKEYGEYFFRILPLVSPDLRNKLIEFNKLMTNDRHTAGRLLEELTPDIKKELEELN